MRRRLELVGFLRLSLRETPSPCDESCSFLDVAEELEYLVGRWLPPTLVDVLALSFINWSPLVCFLRLALCSFRGGTGRL